MDNLTALSFADFVAEQAVAVGVAPADMVLEVTESRLMAAAELRGWMETSQERLHELVPAPS